MDGVIVRSVVYSLAIIVCLVCVKQVAACATDTERKSPIIAFDLHGVVLRYDWLKIIPTLVRFDQKWSLVKNLYKLPVIQLWRLLRSKPSFEQVLQLIGRDNSALHELLIQLSAQQKLVPEVAALIESLYKRGYPLHVVSNIGAESFQRVKARFSDTFNKFSVVITSDMHDQLGRLVKKPEKLFFDTYLHTVRLEPEEVIFIDDRADNISAAKAMGMQAILFKNVQQLNDECKNRGLIA